MHPQFNRKETVNKMAVGNTSILLAFAEKTNLEIYNIYILWKNKQ